jgi:hypothetical protein
MCPCICACDSVRERASVCVCVACGGFERDEGRREGADMQFLGLVASAAAATEADHLYLLTGGTTGRRDRPGDGVFLLAGPAGAGLQYAYAVILCVVCTYV